MCGLLEREIPLWITGFGFAIEAIFLLSEALGSQHGTQEWVQS